MYHQNIFGSSSIVFGNLRKSADTFGNFRKFSENVQECSFGFQNNFGKSSEIFGKWSEIFEKSSKTPSSVYLFILLFIYLLMKILFCRASFQIYIKRHIFYLSLWPFDLSILTVSIRKMNYLLLLFNGIKTTNNKSKQNKMTIFKSSCFKLERKTHFWTY